MYHVSLNVNVKSYVVHSFGEKFFCLLVNLIKQDRTSALRCHVYFSLDYLYLNASCQSLLPLQ